MLAKEAVMSQVLVTDDRQFRVSTSTLWTGRVLSGLGVLFLAFDASLKVFALQAAIDGTVELGYQASVIRPLGVLQVALLVLYLVPRTSVLGAILWTGYLGGAIATHVRLENPLFTHILFPIYIAAFLWAGLWLRDRRVRALLGPHA
jgi:hypothetical protein